jgi:hypothetical protein
MTRRPTQTTVIPSSRARANWLRALEAAKRHLRDQRSAAAAAALAAATTGPQARLASPSTTNWRHLRLAALVHCAEGLPADGFGKAYVKAHIVKDGVRAKARQATLARRASLAASASAGAPAAAPSSSQQQQQQQKDNLLRTCTWQEMLTVEALLALDEESDETAAAAEDAASARRRLAAAASRQGLDLVLRIKAPRPLLADVPLGEVRIPLADVIERPAAWSAPRWLPIAPEGGAATGGASSTAPSPPSRGRMRVQLFLSRAALPNALRVLCATWNVGNAVPPSPQQLREEWLRLPPLPSLEGGEPTADNNASSSSSSLPHLVFVGAQECNFARESAKMLKRERTRAKAAKAAGEEDEDEEPEALRSGAVIGGGSPRACARLQPAALAPEQRTRGWLRRRRRRAGVVQQQQPSAVAGLSPAASVVAAADAVAALYRPCSSDEDDDDDDDDDVSSDDDDADGAPGKWRPSGGGGGADASRRLAAADGSGDATRTAPLSPPAVGLGGHWATGDGKSPGGGDASAAPTAPAAAPIPSSSGGGGGGSGGIGGLTAGLRAQVDSAAAWEACCSQALGPDYFLVGSRHMFQTRALLYARADVVPDVSRVRTDSEATGVGRVAPNKGGVGVACRVGCTDLVFVGAHLAAHQSRCGARVQDVSEIVGSLMQGKDKDVGGGGEGSAPRWGGGGRRGSKRPPLQPAASSSAALLHSLPLGTPGADICTGFDHSFWVGDLNFRLDYGSLEQDPIDTPLEEDWSAIVAAAQRSDWPPLRACDQLSRVRREGRAFYGWREAELSFAPTFKVAKGRAGERYARKRAPAWTDRVLWRSALGGGEAEQEQGSGAGKLPREASCLAYWSAPGVSTSDHKPVAALLSVPTVSRTVAAAAAGYGGGGAGGVGGVGAAATAARSAGGADASAAATGVRGLRARSAGLLLGGGGGHHHHHHHHLRAPSAFGGLLLHRGPRGAAGARSAAAAAGGHGASSADPEAVAVPYRLVLSSARLDGDAATWSALLREAATPEGGAVAGGSGGGGGGGGSGGGGMPPRAISLPRALSRAASSASSSGALGPQTLSVRLELRGACLSRDQPAARGGGVLAALAGWGRRSSSYAAKPGRAVARSAAATTLTAATSEQQEMLTSGPLSALLLPARLGDLLDERLVLCVVASGGEGGGERTVARAVVPLAPAVAAARTRSSGGGGAAATTVSLERCGRRVGEARLSLRLVEALKVESLAASAALRMASLVAAGRAGGGGGGDGAGVPAQI